MKTFHMFAVAGLIAATLGTAANADPRDHDGWHHDRDHGRDWHHHRHCWMEHHRHHDVRVCR